MDAVDNIEPGLYCAAFFDDATTARIGEYLRTHKVPNPVAEPSLHTTIVYSRVPVRGFEAIHTLNVEVNTTYSNLEIWETAQGNTLVLHYFSPYLFIRFQDAMSHGATYDFEEYKPHVTLSYDVGPDFDLKSLPPINFPLIISGEYMEELDDN